MIETTSEMSPASTRFIDIYDLVESTRSPEQLYKRFMQLIYFQGSCISLNKNCTKYCILRNARHLIQYFSAFVLQEDNATENHMGYLKISSDNAPFYYVSQLLPAHSLMDPWQAKEVII